MNELLVKSKVTKGVEHERTADPSPEAWQALHHQFRDCFARRETWEQLFRYWMERCGKEALVEGTATGPGGTGSERSRQRFLSAAFIRLSVSGEAARRSFQEAKDTAGLGRYAVRTYIKFSSVIITIDFCLSIIVLPSTKKPGPISPVFYV